MGFHIRRAKADGEGESRGSGGLVDKRKGEA